MKIQSEQDMNEFCEYVNKSNKSFDIPIQRKLSVEEIQLSLSEIILAESPNKVATYSGKEMQGLFIQGIDDVLFDRDKSLLSISEIPRYTLQEELKNMKEQ